MCIKYLDYYPFPSITLFPSPVSTDLLSLPMRSPSILFFDGLASLIGFAYKSMEKESLIGAQVTYKCLLH